MPTNTGRPRLRLKLEKFDELTGGKDASLTRRAELVGSDPASVSRYRNGKQRPGERFIARCLQRLAVPFDELFEYEAS